MDIAKEREERENFTAESVDLNSESPPLGSSISAPQTAITDKNSPPTTRGNSSPPTSRGISTSALPPRASDKNNTPTARGNYSPPTSRGRTSPTSRGRISPITRVNYSPPTARNQNVSSHLSNFEGRDFAQDKDNSTKDAQGSDKNSPSSSPSTRPHLPKLTGSQPAATTTSTALLTQTTTDSASTSSSTPSSRADSPQLSPTPKSSRKKFPGMSPKMMLRVGQWESHTSIAVTSPSRTVTSGGRGMVPSNEEAPPSHTITTPHSTNTTSTAAATDSKRYSFQAKTISPSSSSSFIPPRSMSESRSSSAGRVSVSSRRNFGNDQSPAAPTKRSSYDETNSKSRLETPEEDYKASSLPRGTKIAAAERKQLDRSEGRILEKDAKLSEVATEAAATPGSHTEQADGSPYQSRRGENREMDGNTSGRGAGDESETSRKSRARKSRQARKPTQPVPANILEQITKHDELELSLNSSEEASATSLDATEASRTEDVLEKQPEANSKTETRAPSHGSSAKSKDEDKPVMSTYRPSARPTSRILQAAAAMSVQQQQQSTWPPSSGKTKMADVVEQKMKLDLKETLIKSANTKSTVGSPPSSSSVPTPAATSTPVSAQSKPSDEQPSSKAEASGGASPGHSRTKSNTRRRPREKRRSTGIVAPEDIVTAEDILAESEVSTQVRKAGDGLDSSPPPTANASTANVSSETLEPGQAEESAEEHKHKMEEMEARYQRKVQELAEAKKKIADMNRRYQDAVRAYEQERKMVQDLKQENQRMKDENSALIRVIGKLSRTPNQNQPHPRQ